MVLGFILLAAGIPMWVQIIIGAAAFFTAVVTLWTKAIKPGAKVISRTEEMLPLLVELTAQMKNVPNAFEILKEVASQFRTNAGSSLRDCVNRLEAAAVENRAAADTLKVQVEVARKLAEQDRKQLERLVTLLNFLDAKINVNSATGYRIENNQQLVASDLAEAHERADLIEAADPKAPPGAMADAAMSSKPIEQLLEEVQRAQREVDEARRRVTEHGETPGGSP